MSVTTRAPDEAAFAPFGAFLPAPTTVGAQLRLDPWLEPVPGRAQRCHLNRVTPSTLPLLLDRVERHPRTAQLFLPVDVSRYLVTVMPADEDGAPEPDRALSFVVPGSTGVVYRAGTWHAPITALDREATFAVLMWRGGDDDDVFAPIPPLELRSAERAAPARSRG